MNDPIFDALLQTAYARSAALVQKDGEAMARILAEEFIYINSKGRVLTKGEYLQNYVVAPEAQWSSQTMEDVRIQLYDDMAWLAAKVHDVATFAEHRIDAYFQTLFVYRREQGEWRCVAGQSTAIV